jgi:hypothetical protein
MFFDDFDVLMLKIKKIKIFLIYFQVKNTLHHNTTHTHLIKKIYGKGSFKK